MRNLPERLFYYGRKEHLLPFLTTGCISFGHSLGYTANNKLTIAQKDFEHRRTANLSGNRIRLRVGKSLSESVEIPGIRSVDVNVTLADYYIRSFTVENNPRFFSEFNADTCICINKVPDLLNRTTKAMNEGQLLHDWDFIADYVKYRKTSSMLNPQNEDELFFLKASPYAYQREFRFIMVPRFRFSSSSTDRLSIYAGDLRDICSTVEALHSAIK